MAINGTSAYSRLRVTGLGPSGIDTESIVSQLMKVEKIPIDKRIQKKQLAQWKQDAYREITTTLKGFKSGFFDVLNPSTNMTSQSNYKKFSSTVLENGVASTVVSVAGNADATYGSHTVVVNKIATADVAQGTAISIPLSGTGAALVDAAVPAMNGQKFNLTLDGTTKEITIGNYATVDDLAVGLQAVISTAFGKTSGGSDKVKVTNNGGILTFEPNTNTVNNISLTTSGSDAGLTSIGFSSGASNRINTALTLGQLSNKLVTPLTFGAGTTNVSSASDIADLNLSGKSFSMTVDGVTQSYTFSSNPADVNDLVSTINTWASTAFGAGKVNISANGNKVSFDRGTANYFTLSSGTLNYDALQNFNITSGSKAAAELKFNINSVDFTFNASQTLSNMFSTINTDAIAKVNISYDQASDKISITSKQLGAGDNIKITQTSGTFFDGASGIASATPVTTQGQDAEVTIDGQNLVRSTNSISLNGVTYSLLRANPGVTQNVNLSADVNSVYDNIKKFVDKYNEVLTTLNTKISEEYNKDYQPLTDDQKNAMASEDITKWEAKAKTGLLKNDTIIRNVLNNMRKAISDSVSDINGTITSVGITTGSYEEKGKLYIDETKLKQAIQDDPEKVMNLFSKTSSISYTQTSQKSQRYAEEGIANRLSDILQDNIRSTRDSNGTKGILLEKAGIVGDSTEYTNVLFKEIYNESVKISDLTAKLTDKENAYYRKFTNMESMIQKMQAQNTQLLSKLG